jgi:uncharacterized protein (DUF305 family)
LATDGTGEDEDAICFAGFLPAASARRFRWTGAGHGFVAMMIPHHEGAVNMAGTELKYRKYPEMRQLAASIVAARKREIAEMRDWQKTHQLP